MANITTFDTTVAARTRAADHILKTPALLSAYEERGGLPTDLQRISENGHRAEVLSQVQSSAQAAGGAATFTVLSNFRALQKEYNAVMSVLQAVRHDLGEASAPAEVMKSVDRILINEAEIYFRTETDPKGNDKKVAAKRASQEALRAEIGRDARALVELTAIHSALSQRKVSKPRLDALLAGADALAGKLAERATAKGVQKQATSEMHDAVSAQKKLWGACYRILAAVGQEDTGVAQLLADAARKRSEPKPKNK
ncbi:Hypothetical protein A7982_07388 [Minicystis rosea]|nr:Hypothetical protein A7982_07388 [Minicystis rosea]